MTIFLTGDAHGDGNVLKLVPGNFDAAGLTRKDYVIVLGDFGFPWNVEEDEQDAWWLDWYEARPWTTLFVDGNHESFDALAAYPTEEWHGGLVHRIRDHVLHLRRAQVFDIGGSTFFVMGGGKSIDRERRRIGVSWWPEEIPGPVTLKRAEDRIAEVGRVDYVLTHCPPARELEEIAGRFGLEKRPDPYADWLQGEVADRLGFKRWFYGHMHVDLPARKPFTPLYEAVYDLDAGTCVGACDPYPMGGDPVGVTFGEYARFLGCPAEDVENAARVALAGSTMGIGEDWSPLMYRQDLRRVLRSMGSRPPGSDGAWRTPFGPHADEWDWEGLE